ncbi:MAG: hypothetical protein LDLANPLL_00470 [Turneriella sp.]|nr:hypothetical protein [Turneriella sp.]
MISSIVARPSMAGLTGATTSENKIYPLRSLRCRGSSRARHSGHKDRGQSTSGTLVLCFAASGLRHIDGA